MTLGFGGLSIALDLNPKGVSVLDLVLGFDNLWAVMILATFFPLLLYCIQWEKNDTKRKKNKQVPMFDSILENFFHRTTGVMCALSFLAIIIKIGIKFLK